MTEAEKTTVSFETQEIKRVTRQYDIELDPEQAAQFEALRGDPEAQQVFLLASVEEGTAKLREEQVTDKVESVTSVKADYDESPQTVASSEFQEVSRRINDSANVEYEHTIVFNEADENLGGAIRSEERVYATNFREAIEQFMSNMEAEDREVLRVFPPKLPPEEIPKWVQHDNGIAQLVPIDGEDHVFSVNQYAAIDVTIPPNPDESISVAVRVGDEVIDNVEITPAMLAEAQQSQGGPGASPTS